jgi:hypothetical protein
MVWVGHKDLKTILRYAAKVNMRKEENHSKATAAFTGFTMMGD